MVKSHTFGVRVTPGTPGRRDGLNLSAKSWAVETEYQPVLGGGTRVNAGNGLPRAMYAPKERRGAHMRRTGALARV